MIPHTFFSGGGATGYELTREKRKHKKQVLYRTMGRSLADLLDAQDKRGGASSSGGDGGSSRWQADNPSHRRQPSRDSGEEAIASRWRRNDDDRGRQNPRGHGPPPSPSPSTSRWANVNVSPSRNNRGGGGGWHNSHRGPSNELSYEERRTRIEQKAFEESERAGASGRYDDTEDDDISTWIGPLLDDERTGEKTCTCTYYQDRDKEYPFYCTERGYELLQTLMKVNAALLELNQQKIEEEAVASTLTAEADATRPYSADVIVRIGKGLYAHKPTLRTKGVTWSNEEYSHPGLQRMYLRMKSIQRFTEIWALLERADSIGTFDHIYEKGSGRVRIAAIGGGPGYELLAARLFFEEKCPDIELELICMDVCEAWRPCAEKLGFRFVQYDITNENTNPLKAAGLEPGELDFCIISCVMIYCTTRETMNMFYEMLHEGTGNVGAALVSERGEKTIACTMFEELGGSVVRLIDQSFGMDERQAIWCSKEFHEANQLRRPDYNGNTDPTFPNVPYEEHKQKRRRRALN